jgi:sigma-B regulation protein RsbU (phosphoserine phosphatase)
VLYTDGVTDALNQDGGEFGVQRLEQVLRSQADAPAADIAAALERALKDFTGGATTFDDITLVVIKRS